MNNSFSAAPQALGYLYQARVSLYMLLQAEDETEVRIEALDDIELSSSVQNSPLTLTQLKHHTVKNADLTDSSSDIWKSIRVWAEQISNQKFLVANSRLFLITTQIAAKDSIAYFLSIDKEKRDTNEALKKLNAISQSSKNKNLEKAFNAFNSLTSSQKKLLVSSVTVLDDNPLIDEYKNIIKKLIRPSVNIKHLEGLYERLEGWWINKVIDQLINPIQNPSISGFELNEKIADLARSFSDDDLPIDFLNINPDLSYIESSRNKQYLKQLELLALKPRALEKAIFDYYKAYHQRSRWITDGLITPSELTEFEERLIDEWERYCDLSASTGSNKTADELIEFGKNILYWMEIKATHLRIRPKVDCDFVRRGSYHILADETPTPRVYWHPEFISIFQQAISKATV